jgi:JmjC domain, hydroxylase
MFSPSFLKDHGVAFSTCVQHQGEFVITFPRAFHAGFNHGFNIAESTNFATPRWFEVALTSKRCVCRPYSVCINVDHLETLFLREATKINQNYDALTKRTRCNCRKIDRKRRVGDEQVFACDGCKRLCHATCSLHPKLCDICYALEENADMFDSSSCDFVGTDGRSSLDGPAEVTGEKKKLKAMVRFEELISPIHDVLTWSDVFLWHITNPRVVT